KPLYQKLRQFPPTLQVECGRQTGYDERCFHVDNRECLEECFRYGCKSMIKNFLLLAENQVEGKIWSPRSGTFPFQVQSIYIYTRMNFDLGVGLGPSIQS